MLYSLRNHWSSKMCAESYVVKLAKERSSAVEFKSDISGIGKKGYLKPADLGKKAYYT